MSRSRKNILETENMLTRLAALLAAHEIVPPDGIVVGYDFGKTRRDAEELRKISMTLRRWHDLECGDSNDYASWAIERDGDEPDSKPYMVRHSHCGDGRTTRTPIADRETGARKRLARIMARYPGLIAYVQGDPRGCALYILKPGDVPVGEDISCYYSRGLAVFQ